MFKKRNIEKKVDVAKDIEDIEIPEHDQQQNQASNLAVPKSINTKKINKFSNQLKKQSQPVVEAKKPTIIKYGLIDKDEVNSKYHANQQTQQQKQPQKHSIMSIYIKKKMQQLSTSQNPSCQPSPQNPTTEILQLQKKYLQPSQQKLSQYDISQILKKLQNMATQSIKTQTENRNAYLKNLLQNQHEKMEYASKKQLKVLRQEKQRIENQFRNKYNQGGRRGYVEKVKYQAMFNK